MRMRRPYLVRCAAGLAAAGIVATAMVPVAPAAPLDEETCQQLKREVGDLQGIGARANLAKGPVWGKANLSSAQLEQVKKLIEIEEAVAFRCPRPKPVPVVQPGVAAGKVKAKVLAKGVAKAEPGSVQTPEVAPTAAATAKPKPKPKPKPNAATPDGQAAAAVAPPPVKPRPKPAATKPQDAFTPPPAKASEPAK